MKFDDVIAELGEFGPYQKRLYFLVCLVGIPAALNTMASVFIQATPDHRCAVPGLANDSYASQGAWHDATVNDTVAWDEDEDWWSECSLLETRGDRSSATIKCNKWVYSKDPFESTFSSDENLVCDDKSLVTYASMIMMAGMFGGSIVMGILSDIIGRKKVLILAMVGQTSAAFGTSWAESYAVYVTMRFLVLFFGIGQFLSAFVIGMELVGPSKRRIAGIVIEMFWCIGLFLETGIAYAINDWRTFQRIICIPSVLICITYIFLMPESPRWLTQKGRKAEAAAILQMVAEKNGVVLSEKARTLDDLEVDGKGEKIWLMFSTKTLTIRTLVVFFNWMVASMVYYGLSLNAEALSGDIYLNFFLLAVVELASYIFCLIFLDISGRKFLQCFSMVLGGIACIATMFPVMFGDDDMKWLTTTLSLIGKFGASAGFAVIYVYSAELFPTGMRNSGMGACSLMARIGGILAPYIGDLDDHISGHLGIAIPLLVFGGLSVAAGLLVLFLPETSNKILPDNIADAKNFGKSKKSSKKSYALESLDVDEKGQTNPSFRMDNVL